MMHPMQLMDNINVFYYLSWMATAMTLPVLLFVEVPKVMRRR